MPSANNLAGAEDGGGGRPQDGIYILVGPAAFCRRNLQHLEPADLRPGRDGRDAQTQGEQGSDARAGHTARERAGVADGVWAGRNLVNNNYILQYCTRKEANLF